MRLTRRGLFGFAALAPWSAAAQGIASRGVEPLPKPEFSGRPFPCRFVDVGRQAGLQHPTVYGVPESREYIIETVGCGCAFIDYDNDGWLDLFVLCGRTLAGEDGSATNRLYRNNRDGTFTDVTREAGLYRTGWASSVCVGDFDNDGFEDLFVTYWGRDVLYRNNGDGTFVDVTEEAGIGGNPANWGAGASFVDFDRDGHLDLAVANYLAFDFETVPKPGERSNCVWRNVPVFCGPMGLPPGGLQLYRNNGDGTFRDVTETSGVGRAKGYAMTVVVADFDRNGWPDLYVACDSTFSLYFRNNRDGTYSEEALERGVAVSEDGVEQAGMGVAVGDFNLDGQLDLLKTHFANDTHGLYENTGEGMFEDVTLRAGLGVETRYVGWGAGMADLDNNGWPDLAIVTGNVYPGIERRLPAYPYRTPRLVFRNLGDGSFEWLPDVAGPGLRARHSSRGCAFGDFDNDGDVDIAVVNLHEPPSLLRNDQLNRRNWIKILLEGTRSNRSAIGATVAVRYGDRTQAQAVTSQASFYSANDRRLHFGLGEETEAAVEIHWPSGETEEIEVPALNCLCVVREGEGIIEIVQMRGLER